VINFSEWPLNREHSTISYHGSVANDYPDCLNIVEMRVRPARLELQDTNSVNKAHKKLWWIYANTRPELHAAIADLKRVLVTSRVSAHHFVSFVPTDYVFSDRLVVFALDSFDYFTILSSTLHDCWAHRPGTTTHETRNTYFPEKAFGTFPLPRSKSDSILTVGEQYERLRNLVTLERNEGLTKTYNRFHNPDESSHDIQKLRDLHVEMDIAVAAAYGWSDLQLDHGFHETKQGIRFTISEPARREVLQRLLKLNHERYAEEVKQGLHGKKKTEPKKASKPAKKSTPRTKKAPNPPEFQQPRLFDEGEVE
jgi:hypothetical protein